MTALASLHVYPVKSCRGIDVNQWPLDRFGLVQDRRRMVVGLDGWAITQREQPALALVRTDVSADEVIVSIPGAPPMKLDEKRAGTMREVHLFEHTGLAVDEGDEVAAALTAFLGVACRLVRIAREHRRPLDEKYFSGAADAAFADGYPLLIASEASLEDLNRRLDEPLPMRRFRPNLVVRGCAAFEEDTWSRIRIGEVELAVVKDCARCVITTVDPETGAAWGPEPLRTLATFRRNDRNGVTFGQNAVALAMGRFSVGDPVEVLARR